mmetsp:Transcript_29681/g.55955  ORF Transcript_29681/g.55955 Transcript_29681/m.55955 type:complete len:495 (-) Transcript_29681:575-2059(-)
MVETLQHVHHLHRRNRGRDFREADDVREEDGDALVVLRLNLESRQEAIRHALGEHSFQQVLRGGRGRVAADDAAHRRARGRVRSSFPRRLPCGRVRILVRVVREAPRDPLVRPRAGHHLLQLLADGVKRGAALGIWMPAAPHERGHGGRHARREGGSEGFRARQVSDLLQHNRHVVGYVAVGLVPREHLKQQHPEGVNVRLGGGHRVLHQELGGHPEGCAAQAGRLLLDAQRKVCQLGVEVLVHQHVARLEVVMQHRRLRAVQVLHAGHHVLQDAQRRGHLELHRLVLQQVVQRAALRVLHHQQRLPAVGHVHRAHNRNDAGVAKEHHRLDLSLELLVQRLVSVVRDGVAARVEHARGEAAPQRRRVRAPGGGGGGEALAGLARAGGGAVHARVERLFQVRVHLQHHRRIHLCESGRAGSLHRPTQAALAAWSSIVRRGAGTSALTGRGRALPRQRRARSGTLGLAAALHVSVVREAAHRQHRLRPHKSVVAEI